MTEKSTSADLLNLTAEIVASHVSHNIVSVDDLPQLIRQVHASLAGVSEGSVGGAGERPEPAVPIKKSISSDYIICLEDGKKLKMLKRHLMTSYKLTPDQYRVRWGLPPDYPMVAPNYASQRSALAKKIGLGTKRRRRRA
jgi:predicted transcriptional regulator